MDVSADINKQHHHTQSERDRVVAFALESGLSTHEVAAQTGKNERSASRWLHDHLYEELRRSHTPAPRTALTPAQEQQLLNWIAEQKSLVTHLHVCERARQMFGAACAFSSGWFDRFCERHHLVLRTPAHHGLS